MADKVMTVAAAAGAAMLGDRAWLADFAPPPARPGTARGARGRSVHDD